MIWIAATGEVEQVTETKSVLASLEAGVLTLTLNRPDKLNSFNEAMHLALRAGFQRATEDPDVRAVLLTGSGRGFCAGQDLCISTRRRPAMPPISACCSTAFTIRCSGSCGRWRCRWSARSTASRPAPAPISRFACDIVLAARSATLHAGLRQDRSRAGLRAEHGSLPRLIGEARAKALALTAEPLDAETAASWGLIWQRG